MTFLTVPFAHIYLCSSAEIIKMFSLNKVSDVFNK